MFVNLAADSTIVHSRLVAPVRPPTSSPKNAIDAVEVRSTSAIYGIRSSRLENWRKSIFPITKMAHVNGIHGTSLHTGQAELLVWRDGHRGDIQRPSSTSQGFFGADSILIVQ